jgi:hypothetical protein
MAVDDVAASGRAAEQRWLRRVVLRRQASASHLVQSLLLGRDAWRSTICMASGWLRVLELDQHPGCSRRPTCSTPAGARSCPRPCWLAHACSERPAQAQARALSMISHSPLWAPSTAHLPAAICPISTQLRHAPGSLAGRSDPSLMHPPGARSARRQSEAALPAPATAVVQTPPPPAARKRALPSRPRVRLLSQGVAQAPKTLLCSAHILRRPLAVSARCSPPPAVVCPTTRPPREIAQLPPTGTALHLPAVRLLPGDRPSFIALLQAILARPRRSLSKPS